MILFCPRCRRCVDNARVEPYIGFLSLGRPGALVVVQCHGYDWADLWLGDIEEIRWREVIENASRALGRTPKERAVAKKKPRKKKY